MNNRLSQEELAQVIAEVERLSPRREAEFDREQVKQILQEFGLSPTLLGDA
jgi:indole-3-glycerol phosphate synthase